MGILQRRGNAGSTPAAVDTFYADALAVLPSITTWAVAASGEFRRVQRSSDDTPIRGVLHHDGAMLRFTTWGQIQRFERSPMEFGWSADAATLTIFGEAPATYTDFAPLSTLVSEPPPFASPASDGEADPFFGLRTWLDSWS